MTGLAKERPGVVGDNSGAKQVPNQEDLHGVLMGFILLGRRQEPLNDFIQASVTICIFSKTVPIAVA